ncbi:MAG TPA: hypothetical protein VGG31_02540 [Candidatus Dormibacteraeota bacterium]
MLQRTWSIALRRTRILEARDLTTVKLYPLEQRIARELLRR